MTNVPERILPGYVVPLHRSLTEPILLAGAPRNYFILVCTAAAILAIGLKMIFAGLGLWFAGHAFGVFFARKDPQFLEVVMRHVKHRSELSC